MKHNVKEISLRKVENTIYVAEGDRSKCIEQLKNKFGLVLYADAETPETLAAAVTTEVADSSTPIQQYKDMEDEDAVFNVLFLDEIPQDAELRAEKLIPWITTVVFDLYYGKLDDCIRDKRIKLINKNTAKLYQTLVNIQKEKVEDDAAIIAIADEFEQKLPKCAGDITLENKLKDVIDNIKTAEDGGQAQQVATNAKEDEYIKPLFSKKRRKSPKATKAPADNPAA